MRKVFAVFLFISVLHLSICDLCKICECSTSDNLIEYNCDGKLDQNSDDLEFLSFIYEDPPNKLILSNNFVNETSLERIKYLTSLQFLVLSHNNITKMDSEILESFTKLRELDLSWNNIENIDIGALAKVRSLEYLDLSHNKIGSINGSLTNPSQVLSGLSLSNNIITELPKNFTNNFPKLSTLDLSNNSLTSFEHYLSNIEGLELLNLEHNSLNSTIIEASIRQLRVGYNELTSLPRNLSVESLSIENNKIKEIQSDEVLFSGLKYLNLSGNYLSMISNFTLPILKGLDISNNLFASIPENFMSHNLPSLETLIMNGNPIKELKFFNELKLRNFVMKNTTLLNAIYDDALEKLKGQDGDCINITISSNKNLKAFDEESIRGMDICYLDLSENGLTRISQKLEKVLNETLPEYGVNLQGNPFICDCKSEWMLERLVPNLYALNPELLIDLKCASPLKLFDKRMVHWMKWKGQVFCDDNLTGNDFSRLEVFEGSDQFLHRRKEIALKSGSGMVIIVISAVVSLLLLVVTGMIISYKLALRKRRSNRRF
ncbi:toll-like receptor 6 [Diachasma alloeum]|uniref:toll-like receptor 6 n=1 Tax=Diachasma alloeum TaxID=454923 RepID=UPI0007383404|nr:toll-like receptor 6 [Diachasma alloeum]